MNSGNLRLAHARFSDAIELYPENANAHYGLGLVLIDFYKFDKAREHLVLAARLKPELVEADYQVGWIAFKQNKLLEAETAIRRVIERSPEHADAYYVLGQLYERQNSLGRADEALRKSVSLGPQKTEAFLSLARLYVRVAAEREAEAVLEEGIRLNATSIARPDEGMALLYNEKGIMLLQKGKYEAATKAFLQAIQWDANRIEAAFNMGCAYSSLGDPEMALKYFNQYIDIGPPGDETVTIARDVARHLIQRINQRRQRASTDG